MIIINRFKESWDKIELYIISLWLLFLLIMILTVEIPESFRKVGLEALLKKNIIPLAALLFLIIGLVLFSRFKYKLQGSKHTPFTITKIENINFEHLAFLATYIIPLIGFNLGSVKYVIVLSILLITIGAIYVKTHMFYANPSLALLGYHIYKADGSFRTEERRDIILISRERLTQGMNVCYKRLDEKIYYVKVIQNDKG